MAKTVLFSGFQIPNGAKAIEQKAIGTAYLTESEKDGIIKDGGFVGDGCAISQASADIMLDLIIGKKKEEAVKLAESFLKMIKGNATEEDMDALEEAGALQDISHMPARVKCAVLGWHTMEELLKEEK
jgi:nitrogen fixation NifU-like protein